MTAEIASPSSSIANSELSGMTKGVVSKSAGDLSSDEQQIKEPVEASKAQQDQARMKRPWMLWTVRFVVFPWFWAWLSRKPGKWLRNKQPDSWIVALGSRLLSVAVYLFVGLPITLILLFELLISLNETIIAEQANYRLQSDFLAGKAAQKIELPGRVSPEVALTDPSKDRQKFFRNMVERFSPVIVQKMSHHPEWDIPVFIDFDGNSDPFDNVRNEPGRRPHTAGVYGEVTAETADSYYLTYSLYHVKDYDHPIREMLTRWTYHDSDNEGFHVRVSKGNMQIASIETWFHNRFLVFNNTGQSTGTEPVHGKIHLEGDSHPIIYVQPQGHGVRCAQIIDGQDLTRSAKILRYAGGGELTKIQTTTRFDAAGNYALRDFSDWYERGKEDRISKKGELFSETLTLGKRPDGSEIVVGAFISGEDYYIGGWSRPKPMWAWDDGWDEIPVFVWHALPSLSFESHEGTPLSHDYEFSRPINDMLAMKPDELAALLQLSVLKRQGAKWGNLDNRGGHVQRKAYRYVAEMKLKEYVNYLFHALG